MDLTISLDAQIAVPLHQQLYDEIRSAILKGRLLPRQRIPSTRSLAKTLGVSRTTVSQGYEQLHSEGYLETIVGSGTYVCAQLPDELLHSASVDAARPSDSAPIALSQLGDRIRQSAFKLQHEPSNCISFRYGRPALDQFPMALWCKLLLRHCRGAIDWMDYATDFQGYRPLRVAIAHYLARARAVQCDPDQIVLTNGTQQALDLILRLLVEPGDRIAIEEPGYLSARRVFLSHGVAIAPVPVDESGIVMDVLRQCPDPLRFVYVTPSHQFPTGATLSLSRRLELLAWAQHTGSLILEDDYDSEFRYGQRPIPALQGLDQNGRVIYLGTFSKVLFPSLRIGYLVLPVALASVFARGKWLCDRQLPGLEQRVLTDFIAEGHFEHHIRKMRSHYDHKRQALVRALQQHLGDRAQILGEQAGIHLMVRLQTAIPNADLVAQAAQLDVGLMSAQPHYLNPGGHGEFIFGYSELNETQIQTGIQRLAQILLSSSSTPAPFVVSPPPSTPAESGC